jgi:phospholipid/cholesterol/gamma-HCH transport system ATP-binding protein
MFEKIEMKNLSFKYGDGENIFEEVTTNIPLNRTYWLHGPVGSGKGTFLKFLLGLETPTSGSFIINDVDTANCYLQDFHPFKKRMGYCFDQGGLINNRTLFENLSLPLLYHGFCTEMKAKDRIHHYFNQCNIAQFAHQRPAFVPTGVYKLALLIRSLIHFPEMLIWNNPTMGLDEDNFTMVTDLLKEFQNDHGLKHVFMASEDFEFMNVLNFEIMNFADKKIDVVGGMAA